MKGKGTITMSVVVMLTVIKENAEPSRAELTIALSSSSSSFSSFLHLFSNILSSPSSPSSSFFDRHS